MPRIRSLKPEALQHRKVGPLSDRAFRLWVGMITQADDEGRLVADVSWLRVVVLGYHPQVTDGDVEAALAEVVSAGLVRLYAVDGTRYGAFPSWRDHQRIDRPRPSMLPPSEASSSPRAPSVEASTQAPPRAIEPSSSDRRGSEGIGSGSDRRGSEGASGSDVRRVLAARASHATEDESVTDTGITPGAPPAAGRPIVFRMPASIVEALDRAPTLGAVERLRDPAWWQAEVRANPGVDYAAEVLKAEAWLRSNPGRAPKSHHARFMHTWLSRAERPRDEA